MSTLKIRETYVNETKGHQFGQSEVMDAYADTVGELFRDMQEEFGRCISKMYRDVAGRPPIQVGWVFQKRMVYEDARRPYTENDYYLREVWVEVFTEYETQTTVTMAHPWARQKEAA